MDDLSTVGLRQMPRYHSDTAAHSQPDRLQITKPQSLKTPCKDMVGVNESSLCAQWLSTQASDSSAYWAGLSFWVGLLGLAGLILSLAYTRKALQSATDAAISSEKALEIADTNAKLAIDQFQFSKVTSQQTLRAYLHLKDIIVSDLSSKPLSVYINAVNHGETPAYNIRLYNAIDIQLTGSVYETAEPSLKDTAKSWPIAKGSTFYGSFDPYSHTPHDPIVAKQLYEDLRSGFLIMHLIGRVEYEDIFGNQHQSGYHVCVGGPGGAELQKSDLLPGPVLTPWFWTSGNEAS
jgi:hypothetical protein